MTDLNALLAGIVADPHNVVRWLVMADWLEENGQPERAELVRVHRELLRTCTATRETKARKQLHARMMELMRAGVQPCLPQRTITLPGGVPMRFSFIPPGSFLMGSPKSEQGRGENEQSQFVTLTKGFWLGQAPVTQRQWEAVVENNPSHFKGGELPVESVSWDGTRAFFLKADSQLNRALRLPTEAEWEYAARSGTTTPFYWGSELDGTQAKCHENRPYGTTTQGSFLRTTTAVGTYASVSPHPWGLVDILGNVWEWCADWYWAGRWPDKAVDPIANHPTDSGRVLRGGGWCYSAEFCRAACRYDSQPWDGLSHRGFRVAADLSALA